MRRYNLWRGQSMASPCCRSHLVHPTTPTIGADSRVKRPSCLDPPLQRKTRQRKRRRRRINNRELRRKKINCGISENIPERSETPSPGDCCPCKSLSPELGLTHRDNDPASSRTGGEMVEVEASKWRDRRKFARPETLARSARLRRILGSKGDGIIN